MKIFKSLFGGPPADQVNRALKVIAKHRNGDLGAAQKRPVTIDELDGGEKAETDSTALKAANKLVKNPGSEMVRVGAIFVAVQRQLEQGTTDASIAHPTDPQVSTDSDFALSDPEAEVVDSAKFEVVPELNYKVTFDGASLVQLRSFKSRRGDLTYANVVTRQDGVIVVPTSDNRLEIISESPFKEEKVVEVLGFLDGDKSCTVKLKCTYEGSVKEIDSKHRLTTECKLSPGKLGGVIGIKSKGYEYQGTRLLAFGDVTIEPVGNGNVRVQAKKRLHGKSEIKLPLRKPGNPDPFQLVISISFEG